MVQFFKEVLLRHLGCLTYYTNSLADKGHRSISQRIEQLTHFACGHKNFVSWSILRDLTVDSIAVIEFIMPLV